MARDLRSVSAVRRSYTLVLVAALVVGAAFVPTVYEAAGGSDDSVAVVSIEGFVSSSTADAVIEDLREARRNESIRAVVLKVDSPGGSAAASERLYLAVKRTRAVMPVVAAVGATGASGAYYAMLPADDIYVTPASLVGSVGIRAAMPGAEPGGEIRSGPDKGYTSADRTRAQVETLHRAFVESVMRHRGDRLSLTREEVAHAKVYTGVRAVRNGMADEIGTVADAVDAAADAAGLDRYGVVRSEAPAGGLFVVTADGRAAVVERSPVGYDGVDAPTFLMVYGEVEYRHEVVRNDSG